MIRTETDLRAAFAAMESDAPTVDDVLDRLGAAPSPRSRERRSWIPIVAAAAVVLAIAGLVVALARHTPSPRPAAGVSVLCRADHTPSDALSTGEIVTLIARAKAALLAHPRVTISGRDFSLRAEGASSADLIRVCTANPQITFRPVVLTVPRSTRIASAPYLGRLPRTETEFTALSPRAQRPVMAAVGGHGCLAERGSISSSVIACDEQQHGYLLGPALLTAAQLASATAQAPDAGAGRAEWTVSVQPTSAGSADFAAYTSAHHVTGDKNPTSVLSCDPTTTPCADYVGVLVQGTVISVPLTVQPINGGPVVISGGFDEASAESLAAAIAPLPIPLTVVR